LIVLSVIENASPTNSSERIDGGPIGLNESREGEGTVDASELHELLIDFVCRAIPVRKDVVQEKLIKRINKEAPLLFISLRSSRT
jgi:hypothetical protein